VIKRIALHDVVLWLERSRSGEGNWQFKPDSAREADSGATELPEIDELAITGLTVGWHNHSGEQAQRLHLALAVLRKQRSRETLQLELRGEYSGKPLQLAAKMLPPQQSAKQIKIEVTEINTSIGENDLSGSFTLELHSTRKPRISADLRSDSLRLQDFYESRENPDPQPDKLFSRDTLPLSALKLLDGSLTYRANSLRGNQFSLRDLRLNARLEGGRLSADVNSGTSTTARLQINAAARPPQVDLTLSAQDLELADLFRSEGEQRPLTGNGELSLQLQGTGDSVAALMANLDGYARLLAGKGQLNTGKMDTLTRGVWSILGTLTAKNADSAVMNCMASDFEIENGIATSRAFLIDSEHATLFGSGNIDLGEEKVDFLLKPKPKTVTLNVAVPVKVSGTLTDPSYTLEKTQAARKALGVVGLFVFPPAALIGLGELGTGEDNPCLQIARDGTAAAQERENALQRGGTAVKNTLQGAEQKIRQGGTAVKKTFQGVGGKLEGLLGE
jgi:uncharacterized protein involved in outer membrane biogenesis